MDLRHAQKWPPLPHDLPTYLLIFEEVSLHDGKTGEDAGMCFTPIGREIFLAHALFAVQKDDESDLIMTDRGNIRHLDLGRKVWHLCRSKDKQYGISIELSLRKEQQQSKQSSGGCSL